MLYNAPPLIQTHSVYITILVETERGGGALEKFSKNIFRLLNF